MPNRGSFNQARIAKDKVVKQFGKSPWFKGVSIVKSADETFIRINVDKLTPGLSVLIPREIEECAIKLREIGEIKTQEIERARADRVLNMAKKMLRSK